MPTPAQNFFGFSPKATPWESAYAGYDPVAQFQQEQNARLQGELAAGEMNGADMVPGLQRLVAAGGMSPQQATAISRLQRSSRPRGGISERAGEGLRNVMLLRPEDPDYQNKLEAHYNAYPEMFQDPHTLSQLSQLNRGVAKASAPAKVPLTLQRNLDKATVAYETPISIQEKITAFTKANPGSRPPSTDKEWNEAWHLARGMKEDNLYGVLSEFENRQLPLPKKHEDWLRRKSGAGLDQPIQSPAAPVAQPQPAGMTPGAPMTDAPVGEPSQAAPASPQAQSHVVAPNGKVYYFASPQAASDFRAKAGF